MDSTDLEGFQIPKNLAKAEKRKQNHKKRALYLRLAKQFSISLIKEALVVESLKSLKNRQRIWISTLKKDVCRASQRLTTAQLESLVDIEKAKQVRHLNITLFYLFYTGNYQIYSNRPGPSRVF